MRLRPFAPAVGLLALAVAACAPPTPADTPVDVAADAPAAEAPPTPPTPRYDPVAEPAGMLCTVRMGSPASDLAALRDFITPGEEFGKLMLSDPSKVADLFLGSLSAHVDVTAPINAVFFDTERGSASGVVMSFPLHNFDPAQRSAGFDFEAEAGGRMLVTPKRGAGRAAGIIPKQGLACGIFRGGAPTRSHLVCAADRARLDQAGPYLARTVSLLPPKPGVRMEFPESQLRKNMDEELRKSQSRGSGSPGEQEGRRLGQRVGAEWAADLRDMALDVQITPMGITAGLDLRFHSLRSPLSLAMAGRAQGDVPAAFWKVPADASLAFYFPGAAPEAMQAAAAPMWRSIEDANLSGPVAEMWRGTIAKLSTMVLTGGPLIVAHGPGVDAQSVPQDPARRYRGARATAGGWFLVSSFEPVATWTKNLRSLLKAPTFLLTKNLTPRGSAATPSSSAKRVDESFDEVPVRPADGLPAGSIHFVHRIVANPLYAPRPLHPALEEAYEHHLFVAGTAESTWFAVAESDALARAKLLDAVNGTSGGIRSRSDLARLRSLPAGGIGFVTLKGILPLLSDNETTASLTRLAGSMQALGTLSAGGATPIFLSLAPSSAGDEGPSLRVSAEISKAGAKDLIEWFQ